MPNKHGTLGKKTEVPRKTLLQALANETRLLNTNKFKADELCQVIPLKV